MNKKTRQLRRQQLDEYFHEKRSLLVGRRPQSGWIKELREVLGMSMEALGKRMGVIKQRIERIEKDELASKVTLETMEKVAEALECDFVYFLVPKGSLTLTMMDEAMRVSEKLLSAVDKTMGLEKQSISKSVLKIRQKELALELLRTSDRRLWKKI